MLSRCFSRNMIWCGGIGLLVSAFFAFVFGSGQVFAKESYYIIAKFGGTFSCSHSGSSNKCKITAEVREDLADGSWNNGWNKDVNLYANISSDYFDGVTNYYIARWHPQDGMKLRDRKAFTKEFTISDAVVKQKGIKKDNETLGVSTYTLNVCYDFKVHFGSANASGIGTFNGCTDVYVNEYWGALNIVGKNIYNDLNIMENGTNLGSQTIRGNSTVYANYVNLWNNRKYKYKFIGWKNHTMPELADLITNTSGVIYYVSNPVGSKYYNWERDIYGRLYVLDMKPEVSKTFYAYYAPPCWVRRINEGQGTHVKLERTGSTYAGKGKIASGSDLYYGDQIEVKFELDDGYTWEYRKINGKSYNDNVVMHTVELKSGDTGACQDVTISAKAVEDTSSSENTGALIEIKKEEQDEYTKEDIYVKPGDKLNYRVSYEPAAQTEAFSVPSAIKVNGETISNESGLSMVELFNRNSNVGEWANYFNILSSDSMSSLKFTNEGDGSEQCSGAEHKYKCSYDVGDREARQVVNEHVVQGNEVGDVLEEEITINSEEDKTANPSSIRKNGDTSEVITSLITDSVRAMVPYNFKNSVKISNDNTNDYVFAGETSSVSYDITTAPRYNSLVGGDAYATIVKGAKWKAGVCTDKDNIDTCSWYEEKEGDLNTGSNGLEGSSEAGRTNIIVPDLPAGAEVYVRAAVYPAESSDDNWQDPEGNHSWAYSAPATVEVAKKPSFQVWGGDIYVNEVDVPIANKSKLSSCNDETFCSGKVWVFGSWGELAVVADNAGNLTSGAALGYTSNNNGELIANPGGGIKNELEDKLGELTFGSGSGSPNIEKLVETLEKRVTNKETTDTVMEPGQSENIETITIGKGESILYKNEDKNGTLTIKSNIEYNNDNHDTLESIPKVIIYANNINIDCKVKRIDAILIAKNNIDTCPGDFEAAKSRAINSTPLQINGAVIAGGTLNLNRTYGAATGNDSMRSAEIINMDPSWYLWAADIISEVTNGTDDKTNDILVPTYMRELPPRY